MNLLMAPCDFVEWVMNKCGSPSEDCMNCVKVTYWIVLIVGGIISTVLAVAPFLYCVWEMGVRLTPLVKDGERKGMDPVFALVSIR